MIKWDCWQNNQLKVIEEASAQANSRTIWRAAKAQELDCGSKFWLWWRNDQNRVTVFQKWHNYWTNTGLVTDFVYLKIIESIIIIWSMIFVSWHCHDKLIMLIKIHDCVAAAWRNISTAPDVTCGQMITKKNQLIDLNRTAIRLESTHVNICNGGI